MGYACNGGPHWDDRILGPCLKSRVGLLKTVAGSSSVGRHRLAYQQVALDSPDSIFRGTSTMSSGPKSASTTRQELYERVWATPMLKLAPTYGLTGAQLKQLCDRYNVPTPPAGYWMKKEHSKAPAPTPLPTESDPGMQVVHFTPDPLPIPGEAPTPRGAKSVVPGKEPDVNDSAPNSTKSLLSRGRSVKAPDLIALLERGIRIRGLTRAIGILLGVSLLP